MVLYLPRPLRCSLFILSILFSAQVLGQTQSGFLPESNPKKQVRTKNVNVLISFNSVQEEVFSDNMDTWGVSAVDFNSDGSIDLFLNSRDSEVPNQLLLNDGEGVFYASFEDFFSSNPGRSTGSIIGDFDNDGNHDLFICKQAGLENQLCSSTEQGLIDLSINPVLANDVGTQLGASFIDVNKDGLLDLFICNIDPFVQNRLFLGQEDGTFVRQDNNELGLSSAFSVSAQWIDFDLDGWMDLFVNNTNGTKNLLYRNLGNNRFETIENTVLSNLEFSSVGASWGDYDNDGDPDLFIANAGNQNNQLFENENGIFTLVGTESFLDQGGHSHGSIWGDFDNDGWLDLYVANDQNSQNWLYRNNQDGSFSKMENQISGNMDNGFSCVAADFNSDGKLDIFQATRGDQANVLYLNSTSNTNNWLNIKLIGNASNRSALGARIDLLANIQGNNLSQSRQIVPQSGGGTNAQSPYIQHFGLGDSESVQSIQITWPSGQIQTIQNPVIPENRLLEIIEPTAFDFQLLTYYDENNNCQFDPLEMRVPNVNIQINNSDRYMVSGTDGLSAMSLEPGNYSFLFQGNEQWNPAFCSLNSSFSIPSNVPHLEGEFLAIPLSPKCASVDLAVNLLPGVKRLGENCISVIKYENIGINKATDLKVSYTPGAGVNIALAFPVWSYIENGAYIWEFDALNAYESGIIYIRDVISTSIPNNAAVIAQTSIFSKEIDCNSGNNSDQTIDVFPTFGLNPGTQQEMSLLSPDSNEGKPESLVHLAELENLKQIHDFEFSIYPNPARANETMQLEWQTKDAEEPITFQCFDQFGRLRMQWDVPQGLNRYTINTKSLGAGTYFIRTVQAGKTTSKRFILTN